MGVYIFTLRPAASPSTPSSALCFEASKPQQLNINIDVEALKRKLDVNLGRFGIARSLQQWRGGFWSRPGSQAHRITKARKQF